MGHVFRSDMVAEQIGWEKGGPFQKELGYTEKEADLYLEAVAAYCLVIKLLPEKCARNDCYH
jgi:hypothetical protein